jgi:peptidoglycan/xylan/chitin deacetylase (PgdA/CDA1 family)
VSVRFDAVTWAKKGVKLALLGPATVRRERAPGLFVLIYHRIGARAGLELDLPEATFRSQMRHLREHAEAVPLRDALEAMAGGRGPSRDVVAVTFDDGYLDVATRAWPVLRDLAIPATLFLATGFLDRDVPAPLSRAPAAGAEPPEPMAWDQVGEMAASGLVALGSHSRTHRDFDRLSPAEAEDELGRAGQRIRDRVGVAPEVFAYPRAVVGHEEVVARHHRWAVGGDGGKNVAGRFHPHRISRVPVRASDGLFFFRRRISGIAPLEDRLYARLRGSRA